MCCEWAAHRPIKIGCAWFWRDEKNSLGNGLYDHQSDFVPLWCLLFSPFKTRRWIFHGYVSFREGMWIVLVGQPCSRCQDFFGLKEGCLFGIWKTVFPLQDPILETGKDGACCHMAAVYPIAQWAFVLPILDGLQRCGKEYDLRKEMAKLCLVFACKKNCSQKISATELIQSHNWLVATQFF